MAYAALSAVCFGLHLNIMHGHMKHQAVTVQHRPPAGQYQGYEQFAKAPTSFHQQPPASQSEAAGLKSYKGNGRDGLITGVASTGYSKEGHVAAAESPVDRSTLWLESFHQMSETVESAAALYNLLLCVLLLGVVGAKELFLGELSLLEMHKLAERLIGHFSFKVSRRTDRQTD